MPLDTASSLQQSGTVCFDPARMRFGAEGLEPFWWPVAPGELVAFRDHLHERLAALARAAAPRDGHYLRIAMPGLLYRAMALFEAAAVAERAAACGIRPETQSAGVSLRPLLQGEALSDEPMDPRRRMHRLFVPEPIWRGAVRVLRNRLVGGTIPRRRLFEIDPRRGVVTASLNRSIERLAAAEAGPVTYCHPRAWFSTIAPDDGPGCDGALREAVVEAVTEAAAARALSLPAQVTDHLDGYVAAFTALARHHVERLLAKPRRLPRRLWVGSGVSIWARTLIAAVQLNGGEASGFEHGTGESWAERCGDTCFEFDQLDRFVCFTEETARRSAAQQETVPLARDARCSLLALPVADRRAPAPMAGGLPARPRVLVVAAPYRQDRVMRYKSLLGDPVVADWQARLFGRLRAWGYEPLYRPHPEQREAPPDFAGALAVPAVGGSFAAALEAADILLFDISLTSAWRDALRAGKPVVLVDFGQSSLSADARGLAERRMAIVEGGFDSRNRIALDWEALRAALERAPGLDDPSFVSQYFGHA